MVRGAAWIGRFGGPVLTRKGFNGTKAGPGLAWLPHLLCRSGGHSRGMTADTITTFADSAISSFMLVPPGLEHTSKSKSVRYAGIVPAGHWLMVTAFPTQLSR